MMLNQNRVNKIGIEIGDFSQSVNINIAKGRLRTHHC